MKQMHVVNHGTGSEMPEERNCLNESTRIARGPVKCISELKASDFDMLVIPGGFGVAKNLSNYATAGADYKVDEKVCTIIKDFKSHNKPMAFCCIAPVLAAASLPNVSITLGVEGNDAAKKVCKNNVKHCSTPADGICVDEANKVVTTPAYMSTDATITTVFAGIGKMIDQVVKY